MAAHNVATRIGMGFLAVGFYGKPRLMAAQREEKQLIDTHSEFETIE